MQSSSRSPADDVRAGSAGLGLAGSGPVAVVRALAATASRKDKMAILSDAFLSGERDFFTGMRLAGDKLVSFGVTRVPEIAADDLNPDDPGTLGFADFIELTARLRRPNRSGHAARDAIAAAASVCHGPTWNEFYRRVLLKDRQIGCDAITVNAVLRRLAKHLPEAKDWTIPVFGCQLPQDGKTAVHQNTLKGRKLLDIKLDGVRTLAVLDKTYDKVTLFSRNGQIIERFPEVRSNLEQVMAALPGSVVLDGEMVSPHGVQPLRALLKNPDPDTTMVRLAVFDLIPLADFRAGLCATPQWQRHQHLSLLETSGLLRRSGGKVYVLDKQEVDLDAPEGIVAFDAFNRTAIDNGIAGIMIKDPEASYETKRTASWLKIKSTAMRAWIL